MAKLKNSFTRSSSQKLPSLSTGTTSPSGLPKTSIPKDTSGQALTVAKSGSVVQALSFGPLHTKAKGSSSSSSWGGLLNAATSGGSSSLLGGGILSTGTLGFLGKLFGLFGTSKSTPAAPAPFVMPAPQTTTLNVGSPGAVGSVSLGVQSNPAAASQTGPIYQQTGASSIDHASQTTQVVQIVKQALLTSSSLNDVISEI